MAGIAGGAGGSEALMGGPGQAEQSSFFSMGSRQLSDGQESDGGGARAAGAMGRMSLLSSSSSDGSNPLGVELAGAGLSAVRTSVAAATASDFSIERLSEKLLRPWSIDSMVSHMNDLHFLRQLREAWGSLPSSGQHSSLKPRLLMGLTCIKPPITEAVAEEVRAIIALAQRDRSTWVQLTADTVSSLAPELFFPGGESQVAALQDELQSLNEELDRRAQQVQEQTQQRQAAAAASSVGGFVPSFPLVSLSELPLELHYLQPSDSLAQLLSGLVIQPGLGSADKAKAVNSGRHFSLKGGEAGKAPTFTTSTSSTSSSGTTTTTRQIRASLIANAASSFLHHMQLTTTQPEEGDAVAAALLKVEMEKAAQLLDQQLSAVTAFVRDASSTSTAAGAGMGSGGGAAGAAAGLTAPIRPKAYGVGVGVGTAAASNFLPPLPAGLGGAGAGGGAAGDASASSHAAAAAAARARALAAGLGKTSLMAGNSYKRQRQAPGVAGEAEVKKAAAIAAAASGRGGGGASGVKKAAVMDAAGNQVPVMTAEAAAPAAGNSSSPGEGVAAAAARAGGDGREASVPVPSFAPASPLYGDAGGALPQASTPLYGAAAVAPSAASAPGTAPVFQPPPQTPLYGASAAGGMAAGAAVPFQLQQQQQQQEQGGMVLEQPISGVAAAPPPAPTEEELREDRARRRAAAVAESVNKLRKELETAPFLLPYQREAVEQFLSLLAEGALPFAGTVEPPSVYLSEEQLAQAASAGTALQSEANKAGAAAAAAAREAALERLRSIARSYRAAEQAAGGDASLTTPAPPPAGAADPSLLLQFELRHVDIPKPGGGGAGGAAAAASTIPFKSVLTVDCSSSKWSVVMRKR